MRILISADMEGATGVTCTSDVVPGTEQWQRFRRLYTGDVNACVAGLFDGGATEVLVNEAHSAQRNALLEELDPRARMLTGRHKPLSMMQGVDSGVDGVVFLGYHTGAGADGVLAHTYLENSITEVRLDGVAASEGRLNAALAAEHGVPVILVTGDDLTCAEATAYAPRAGHAVVKDAVSRYAAVCSPPAVTGPLSCTIAVGDSGAFMGLKACPPVGAARPPSRTARVKLTGRKLSTRRGTVAPPTAPVPVASAPSPRPPPLRSETLSTTGAVCSAARTGPAPGAPVPAARFGVPGG